MGKGGKATDNFNKQFNIGITRFCNNFKYPIGFNRGLIRDHQASIWQELQKVVNNLSIIDSQAIANFSNLLSASGNQNLMTGYANTVLNNDNARTTILAGNSQHIANFGNLLSASGDIELICDFLSKDGFSEALRRSYIHGNEQDKSQIDNFCKKSQIDAFNSDFHNNTTDPQSRIHAIVAINCQGVTRSRSFS
jgi:hypothetical protein